MEDKVTKIELVPLSNRYVTSLIDVHRTVYPAEFNVRLGDYFIKNFFNFFIGKEGFRGLVALKDGKAIGYLLGYVYNKRSTLDDYLLKQFAKAILRNPFRVFDRIVFKKIIEKIKAKLFKKSVGTAGKKFEIDYSKAYYMFLIAITPEGRGHNIGRKLMLEMERLAVIDGYRYFLGSVAVENLKVLRMWSTIGYEVVEIDPDNPAKYVFKDTIRTKDDRKS